VKEGGVRALRRGGRRELGGGLGLVQDDGPGPPGAVAAGRRRARRVGELFGLHGSVAPTEPQHPRSAKYLLGLVA
jgi:hypothetical protein